MGTDAKGCEDGTPKPATKEEKVDLYNPDFLKNPEDILKPDPRWNAFSRWDNDLNAFRDPTVEDQWLNISQYTFSESVPEKIRIQFETAKNLYLYAWHVYRFYPVAEHHALICIELALRERFEKEIPKKRYYPRSKHPMLKALLKYAFDEGYLINENFKMWNQHVDFQARQRYQREKLQELIDSGEDELEYDDLAYEIKDEDRDWDYVEHLVESLPFLRNNYAHGNTSLQKQVLISFQIASEIVNQVYLQNRRGYDDHS